MSEQLSYYARDLLEQGQDFVIAKVVDTQRARRRRKKGAVMLMRQDGTTIGTVGGGLLGGGDREALPEDILKPGKRRRIYEFTLDEKAERRPRHGVWRRRHNTDRLYLG